MITFKIYLIALIAVTFISCDETNFGNKVMKDFGSGKYVLATVYPTENEYLDLMNATKALNILHDEEVFSLADIYDKEANQKREIENWENSFNIDVMFDNFNLLESQHS